MPAPAYPLVLGLAALLSPGIALVVWRRRPMPGAAPFALLMLAASEWAAGAALEHASTAAATKILFAKLEYPGIVSVAPLWLVFALAYAGRQEWLTRRRLVAIWVVPLATVALAWTNEAHGLVWPSIVPSSDAPGAPLVYAHGAWFWLAAAYSYALNLTGAVVLIATLPRVHRRHRAQAIALVAGLVLPWLGNAAYLSGRNPLGSVDPTPIAFILTGAIYAWGVFRLGLFDLVPVARHVLIENMPDGVLVLDRLDRIIDINPRAREMLAAGDAPLVGESAETLRAPWADVVARHRDIPLAHEEVQLETEHGPRFLDLRIASLGDRQGRPRGRLIVFSDVTARKRTEEALRQNEKLASLGQLLAGVAHELNNPLAVIIGHATLLRRQLEPGAVADRVERITSAAERCSRIITSFLAIARQRRPERAAVDVNQVLRDATDFLGYQLDVNDVTLTLDLKPELPPLWADAHQLQQVAVNLLVNAEQATRATDGPRRITVTSRHDRDRARVTFSVADTGPGIPAPLLHQIFEPFFTTKPVGVGSGLGLSVCKGIVEAHQGTLEVESAPGKGTVFVVALPVAEAPEPPPGRAGTGEAETIRGRRILVVEDEPLVAELLVEMLATDGHRVATAENGILALDRLAAEPFDLVISDIKMRGLDGPALYQQLALRDPGARERFIFITGDTLSADTRRFLEATGAPSLDKPFDADVVRRVVQKVLDTAARIPRSGDARLP